MIKSFILGLLDIQENIIKHINLNPTKIASVLAVIATLLVVASIAGQFSKYMLGHDYLMGFVPLFNVDQERNIPTFFSVFLMLIIVFILVAITIQNRMQGKEHSVSWAILAFGFMFMSYDEAFQVHEELTSPVRELLGEGSLGIFYFSWVIPAIILVFILALFFFRFLFKLPSQTRIQFLLAGFLFLGGAIGLELLGGRYDELYGRLNFTYSMLTAVEEGLEMTGLIVFIRALLRYCAHTFREVRFKFEG